MAGDAGRAHVYVATEPGVSATIPTGLNPFPDVFVMGPDDALTITVPEDGCAVAPRGPHLRY